MIRKEIKEKGEIMSYRIYGENIKYIEVDEDGKISIVPKLKKGEQILGILKKIVWKKGQKRDCEVPEECRKKYGDPPWPFNWGCDGLCKLIQV